MYTIVTPDASWGAYPPVPARCVRAKASNNWELWADGTAVIFSPAAG